MNESRTRLHVVRSEPPALDPSDSDGIFRRHSRYVAGLALRLTGRDDEIDDIVQEVFLQAMRALRELRGDEATRGWLRTVTIRTVRRRLRRRRWIAFVVGYDEQAYENLPAPGATPEDLAVLRRVYDALERLPPDLRIVWLLREVEGERLESIAAMCECSLATVKRRLTLAKQELEAKLQ